MPGGESDCNTAAVDRGGTTAGFNIGRVNTSLPASGWAQANQQSGSSEAASAIAAAAAAAVPDNSEDAPQPQRFRQHLHAPEQVFAEGADQQSGIPAAVSGVEQVAPVLYDSLSEQAPQASAKQVPPEQPVAVSHAQQDAVEHDVQAACQQPLPVSVPMSQQQLVQPQPQSWPMLLLPPPAVHVKCIIQLPRRWTCGSSLAPSQPPQQPTPSPCPKPPLGTAASGTGPEVSAVAVQEARLQLDAQQAVSPPTGRQRPSAQEAAPDTDAASLTEQLYGQQPPPVVAPQWSDVSAIKLQVSLTPFRSS